MGVLQLENVAFKVVFGRSAQRFGRNSEPELHKVLLGLQT